MQFLSENQHIKPPKRSRYSPETVKPDQRSAKDMSSIKLGGGAAGTRQGDRKRKRNPKYANGAGVGGSSGGAPRRQRVKGHKRSGSGDTAGAMTPNLSYMEETPSPEPVRYSGADMGATGGGVGGADALFLPPTHHAISPSHSSKRTRSDSIGTFAADLFNGPLPAANHIVLEFDPLEPIPTTMNLSSTPTAAAAAAAATNAVQPKLNEGGSAERLQKLQAYTLRIHAEREALRTENAEMRYKLDIMKSIVNKLLERDRQRERSASTASSSESSAPTAVV